MRNTLMTGVAVLALPAMVVSAPVFAADDAPAQPSVEAPAEAAMPPAPQGPFFSRGMADNMGFPPMGFDPMNPAGAPVPPGPGQVMNNATGAGLGGGNEVDIQIRGRIKLKGQGAGNQGAGGNNVWQSMPYGMPYNHGYGAPYGTPFNQGFGLPQNMQQMMPQAPVQAPVPAPAAPHAPMAAAPTPVSPVPAAPQTPAAEAAAPAEQAPAQPFSWAPQDGMSGPSGFYAQPQMPAAPQTQPQAQPQPQAAPVQPQRPAEPEWVKKQRAEAEKRQKEAQERFAEMQKNNPYAQQRGVQQPGQSVWSGPHNMNRGFGMPFQHGYGAPYGAPFGGQPYGYAQPQAPAESGGAEK